MAIVGSAELQVESRSAVFDRDGTREYSARYRVKSDDVADGPQQVILAPGLPRPPATYAIGNDRDDEAVIDSLTPTWSGSKQCWFVDAVWKVPEPGAPVGVDGLPTIDPLTEIPQIEVSFRQNKVPVEEAIFVGPVQAQLGAAAPAEAGRNFRHPFLIPGDISPLINSAGEEFDDPALRDEADVTIRITRNQENFSAALADDYMNAINIDAFQIARFGFVAQFGRAQAKMNDITASQQIAYSNPYLIPIGAPLLVQQDFNIYWRVTYEVQFKDTWDIETLDKGKRVLALPGNPDRRGFLIDEDQVVDVGEARYLQEVTDIHGQPTGVDALLGGDGMERQERFVQVGGRIQSRIQPPVYHKWQIYKSRFFRILNL